MTTDTDALQERIARVLHKTDPIGGHSPDWKRLSLTDREWYVHKATAILPIIRAEVRKAKAEAWDEGGAHVEGRGGYYDPDDNPYRETGDSDERR